MGKTGIARNKKKLRILNTTAGYYSFFGPATSEPDRSYGLRALPFLHTEFGRGEIIEDLKLKTVGKIFG